MRVVRHHEMGWLARRAGTALTLAIHACRSGYIQSATSSREA
jgi:hypothetical protein